MCAVRLVLARPVEGTVRERDRLTHLIPLREAGSRPALVRACCGRAFGPGELEVLDGVTGMPCEACLRKAPGNEELGVAGDAAIEARIARLERVVELLAERVDRIARDTRTLPGLFVESSVRPVGGQWRPPDRGGADRAVS